MMLKQSGNMISFLVTTFLLTTQNLLTMQKIPLKVPSRMTTQSHQNIRVAGPKEKWVESECRIRLFRKTTQEEESQTSP